MNILKSPPFSTFNMDFINVVIWAKNNIVQNTWYFKIQICYISYYSGFSLLMPFINITKISYKMYRVYIDCYIFSCDLVSLYIFKIICMNWIFTLRWCDNHNKSYLQTGTSRHNWMLLFFSDTNSKFQITTMFVIVDKTNSKLKIYLQKSFLFLTLVVNTMELHEDSPLLLVRNVIYTRK
jgi:hypothetical protein